jgi:hypothetical protein
VTGTIRLKGGNNKGRGNARENHIEMSQALKERYKFLRPSDTYAGLFSAWSVTGGGALPPGWIMPAFQA